MSVRTRVCECGKVEITGSKSLVCRICFEAKKKPARIEQEKLALERLGYVSIVEDGKDSHGKRRWSFIHSCGTKQSWIFPNILKQLKSRPNEIPCSKCGGLSRMAHARTFFMAKYGITEEQMKLYERYQKKVRHLSDRTYKLHQSEINPHGFIRGMLQYHLDHKVPIIEGFKRGLPPEELARKENLQMLPAFDNLSKGRK